MNEQKEPSATAHSVAQTGEAKCEVIASQSVVHAGSGVAVSPAISLAISPSTDENYKTESDGDKSSNKPGSESTKKPNCYDCKYRVNTDFSAHSRCTHPRIGEVGQFVEIAFLIRGQRGPAMKRLNVSGDKHGIANGWFMWPMDFDPCWLNTCDGFTSK